MFPIRAVFTLLFVGVLTLAGLPWAPNSPTYALAQEQSGIGTPLPIANEEGVPVGSVTVTEVIDPFTDFNPDYPSEAGSRFVVANVAFDADAGQRFDIQPWTIVLQDDAGFLWSQASLVLPSDALVPILSSQTLAPGSRITGAIGFVVPEGRVPARIFYQPVSSRIIPLVDLSQIPPPALGETVPIPDSLGGLGSVRVTALNDPQSDLDPVQEIPEGSRFVQVTLVYENSSEGQFFIEPFGLLLRDANGDLWYSSNVSRLPESMIIPDLTGAQLAPGDRLSGAASFEVPAGVAVTGLYVTPVSGQLLQLADFSIVEADAAATPVTTIVPIDDMKPEPDAASVAEDDDPCQELQAWLDPTRERIARAGELSGEVAILENPELLAEHAAEYAFLASEQLAAPVPDAAVPVNKALVATLNAYSSAVQQMLDAGERGDDSSLDVSEAMNTVNAAGARIDAIEGEMANLAASCGLP